MALVSGCWEVSVSTLLAMERETRGVIGVVPHGFTRAGVPDRLEDLIRPQFPTVRARRQANAPDGASEPNRLQNGYCGGQYPEGHRLSNSGLADNRAALVKRRMRVTSPVPGSRFPARGVAGRFNRERAWCNRSTSVLHTEGGGA